MDRGMYLLLEDPPKVLLSWIVNGPPPEEDWLVFDSSLESPPEPLLLFFVEPPDPF